MSDVITQIEGAVGRITLNRPSALHALTTQMCADMTKALLAWKDDPAVRVVQIDHAAGTRGFCSGGDIRMLAESGAKDGAEAREFFFIEYRLNHLLFVYPKPIVALMDGVTMGGGVGLSMPAPFRIATEKTTFAMPETGIGLFPDVGGGWHLPRLPGKVGLWLAMTGARIKAADCIAAGIATHFMPSEILEAARAQFAGAAQTGDPRRALESGLEALSESPGQPVELTHERRAKIDELFGGDSVEAIFAALQKDGSDWAKAQLATLETKSPQTIKVSFRQLREGLAARDFAENMRLEYRIGARVVRMADFAEGVRAVIVEKDNAPRWSPARVEQVPNTLLDEIFAPLPAQEEWSPLPGAG
jgi:enoyl-CoA hydratase